VIEGFRVTDTSADTAAPTPPSDGKRVGRRGLLTASAAAVAGVGVGVAVTSAQKSSAVQVAVSARSIQPELSSAAAPKANTDALNKAIADSASTGADIELPGGEYGFVGLTLPSKGGVTVRGAGRGVTVLRNDGGDPAVTAHGVPGGTTWMSDWSVSGVTFTSSNRQPAQVGLSVKLAHRFSIRDVTIERHGVGVRHESGWDCGYDGVSVIECGTGWLFPKTDFAPSSPVGLRNCSAVDSDVAVLVESGLETLEWVGGDFSECGRGMLLYGNDTRSLSLHGLNFERIRGEDIVVGDAKTGPAAVTFNGCRFLRTNKGPVSVRFVRGDSLTFTGSRWTQYRTAVEQSPDSGTLVVNTSTGFEVDDVIVTSGHPQPEGVLNASAGQFALTLALDGPSVLPAVIGSEGVATKVLSGPGKRTAVDADFAIVPVVGNTAILRDTTDGSVRHAVRGVTGWFVSAPYAPPPPPAPPRPRR
jgi:hypothetical protein